MAHKMAAHLRISLPAVPDGGQSAQRPDRRNRSQRHRSSQHNHMANSSLASLELMESL